MFGNGDGPYYCIPFGGDGPYYCIPFGGDKIVSQIMCDFCVA
jgi:hypothetical protein